MKASTDRILSLTAIFVGVGSLFVIVYQTYLMRESQAASMLPYLMVSLNSNGESAYLVVRNAGVGPALIEEVRVRQQGRSLALDPHDFYVSERGVDRSLGLSVDRLMPGRLIPAGEAVLTLGREGEGANQMAAELLAMFDIGEVPLSWYQSFGVPATGPDKAVVEVTYTSVYRERWRVTSAENVPERLD